MIIQEIVIIVYYNICILRVNAKGYTIKLLLDRLDTICQILVRQVEGWGCCGVPTPNSALQAQIWLA